MLKSEKKQVLNKKMYIEICEKIICDNNNIKTDVLPNLSNKSDQYISLIKKYILIYIIALNKIIMMIIKYSKKILNIIWIVFYLNLKFSQT